MIKLLTFLLAVFTAAFLITVFVSAKNGDLERAGALSAGSETGIVIEDFDYPMDIQTHD